MGGAIVHVRPNLKECSALPGPPHRFSFREQLLLEVLTFKQEVSIFRETFNGFRNLRVVNIRGVRFTPKTLPSLLSSTYPDTTTAFETTTSSMDISTTTSTTTSSSMDITLESTSTSALSLKKVDDGFNNGGFNVDSPTTEKSENSDKSIEMVTDIFESISASALSHRPSVNKDRPSNGDITSVNRDRPIVNGGGPSENKDRSSVNRDRPSVNGDRPSVNGDRLSVNSAESESDGGEILKESNVGGATNPPSQAKESILSPTFSSLEFENEESVNSVNSVGGAGFKTERFEVVEKDSPQVESLTLNISKKGHSTIKTTPLSQITPAPTSFIGKVKETVLNQFEKVIIGLGVTVGAIGSLLIGQCLLKVYKSFRVKKFVVKEKKSKSDDGMIMMSAINHNARAQSESEKEKPSKPTEIDLINEVEKMKKERKSLEAMKRRIDCEAIALEQQKSNIYSNSFLPISLINIPTRSPMYPVNSVPTSFSPYDFPFDESTPKKGIDREYGRKRWSRTNQFRRRFSDEAVYAVDPHTTNASTIMESSTEADTDTEAEKKQPELDHQFKGSVEVHTNEGKVSASTTLFESVFTDGTLVDVDEDDEDVKTKPLKFNINPISSPPLLPPDPGR